MATSKKQARAPEAPQVETIVIKPPRFRTIAVQIKGTSPYMQARFSEKAGAAMREKMMAGTQANAKKKRDARDFDRDFREAQYVSTDGWNGIPASAFRNASIDVCRMVGYKMTHAKMSIFVEAEGHDARETQPLVRLESPKPPERSEMAVRNATGVLDIRVRPLWREWSATVRVRFDEDQFSTSDVLNLLARAGAQVGIGEGRPYSRDSNGIGFGLFEVVGVKS